MQPNKTHHHFLFILFFLSGAAGLGYEILWTRMLTVSLGHEIISMLAVVSAFFSGLALGAWIFDRPVSRSGRPALWYVGFELLIGSWAIILAFNIPHATPIVSSLIGIEPTAVQHWTVAFLYPFFILLPATTAMGGTLPAMDRFFGQLRNEKMVAGLYSINTFGAMAGTFAITFSILPSLGMTSTSIFLACLNFLGAAGVFFLQFQYKAVPEKSEITADDWHPSIRLYLILFCTGLLGMGFEVLMVRSLSQILENTVFSFASILTVYLFGTAAGAALYHYSKGRMDFERQLVVMLHCLSFFCLLSILELRYAETIFIFLQTVFGSGFWPAITAEMVLALVLFLLPTLAMGATFSHLAQYLRGSEGGVGRALCMNTIGGSLAPLLFGIWLVPRVGIKMCLLLVAGSYLFLVPRWRIATLPMTSVSIALLCFILFSPFKYQFVSLPEGDRVVAYQEGVMASVSVVEDERQDLHLKVNNRFQMGGTTSVFSDRRQAHLPLLLHSDPKSALFLGLGTGITFGAAADYPNLQADGVELIPEVINVMPYFEKATGPLADYSDNLNLINADARRYISMCTKKYDVIIADLFHPGRDGAGGLYTVEHFSSIRNLLTDDGLFCQWLPLYQLDLDMLKVITRSFLEVFPDGQAYLAHYSLQSPLIGLVGGRKHLRYPEKWYRKRLQDPSLHMKVASLKYDSFYSLFGTFLAGSSALREYSASSPLNTDDNPVVLFNAPRFVYAEKSPPYERFFALLHELSPADPDEVFASIITEEDYLARERIHNYWLARDAFLQAGAEIKPTRDVKKMYENVREPLLAVVRKSTDFSSAYYPLLAIAYELYPVDRASSEQLLKDLERANPMKREAFLLRSKLFM
ncbi:MAG: hypothetical protein KQH63_13375 [Desulfobulbaceae bacterium]|nr:hypothetical protein [Desulfobulbaceae bacterium]